MDEGAAWVAAARAAARLAQLARALDDADHEWVRLATALVAQETGGPAKQRMAAAADRLVRALGRLHTVVAARALLLWLTQTMTNGPRVRSIDLRLVDVHAPPYDPEVVEELAVKRDGASVLTPKALGLFFDRVAVALGTSHVAQMSPGDEARTRDAQVTRYGRRLPDRPTQRFEIVQVHDTPGGTRAATLLARVPGITAAQRIAVDGEWVDMTALQQRELEEQFGVRFTRRVRARAADDHGSAVELTVAFDVWSLYAGISVRPTYPRLRDLTLGADAGAVELDRTIFLFNGSSPAAGDLGVLLRASTFDLPRQEDFDATFAFSPLAYLTSLPSEAPETLALWRLLALAFTDPPADA